MIHNKYKKILSFLIGESETIKMNYRDKGHRKSFRLIFLILFQDKSFKCSASDSQMQK
jgi:hypothetical protein